MIDMPSVSSIRPFAQMADGTSVGDRVANADPFAQILGAMITNLNALQQNADAAATTLATGGDIDLHDVMIAQEQSSIAMQFTLQVRNRVIEAYQEIMRMQV
ncbi:MAG: flagellar hook-basal body complex protein FliE [Dehalococcoidia bacterium]|nr:flagellar hook-basal body complex protein FliE [Dehalococcoidia bacterium]